MKFASRVGMKNKLERLTPSISIMTQKQKWISLTVFATAMGYLEAAVVYYGRRLLFPEGFDFPLVPIDADLAVMELWREVATVVMLISAGYFIGKTAIERFGWFIFCFAVWDLAYYLFLKVLLNWPSSFLTPDLLFLVPVPWIGPVLAPVIVSASMIVLAALLIRASREQQRNIVNKSEWTLLILGALIIISSFCIDYARFIYATTRDLSNLFSFSVSSGGTFSEGEAFKQPTTIGGFL